MIDAKTVEKVEAHIAYAVKTGAKVVTAASAARWAAPSSNRRY